MFVNNKFIKCFHQFVSRFFSAIILQIGVFNEYKLGSYTYYWFLLCFLILIQKRVSNRSKSKQKKSGIVDSLNKDRVFDLTNMLSMKKSNRNNNWWKTLFLSEKHLREFLKYLIAEKQMTFISELCQRGFSKGSFDDNNILIKVI